MAIFNADLSRMLEDLKSSADADSAMQAQKILRYVKEYHSKQGSQEEEALRSISSIEGDMTNPSLHDVGEGMNKGELIDAVADAAGLSRADSTKAVDGVFDSISNTLSHGGSVSLVGFGTFQVKARAARTGRNPKSGEAVHIKASNVPGFKAGKGLKDAVN